MAAVLAVLIPGGAQGGVLGVQRARLSPCGCVDVLPCCCVVEVVVFCGAVAVVKAKPTSNASTTCGN